MTVMVDELRTFTTKIRCFQRGSCHLTADTLDELHAMAKRLGLKRAWFQDTRVPHYDLTPGVRVMAMRYGAVFVPAKDQIRARWAKRGRVAV